MIRIERTNGESDVFEQLCKLLDKNLDELVGADIQKKKYNQYNTLNEIHHVVLLYVGNQAVGCAAMKEIEPGIAEVKRVYVCKDYRGQGLSKRLMHEIELWAKEIGYHKLVLETGKVLTAAQGLYHRIGYQDIENYGQYKGVATSVCMEKLI